MVERAGEWHGGALTILRWTVGQVEQQVAGSKRQMPDVVKTISEGYFCRGCAARGWGKTILF